MATLIGTNLLFNFNLFRAFLCILVNTTLSRCHRGIALYFINSLSGYKSANLVGTADHQGRHNLAIVSSVVHLGAQPPLVGMIMRPDVVERHTLANIRETGWYTLPKFTGLFGSRRIKHRLNTLQVRVSSQPLASLPNLLVIAPRPVCSRVSFVIALSF